MEMGIRNGNWDWEWLGLISIYASILTRIQATWRRYTSTVYPRSSAPFSYSNLLYKRSHYFFDIQHIIFNPKIMR